MYKVGAIVSRGAVEEPATAALSAALEKFSLNVESRLSWENAL